MSIRWHKLGLSAALSVIALSQGCGGRSDGNANEGGIGGVTPGNGGASAGERGGAPPTKGGAPGRGGAPGVGGALFGNGGTPGKGGSPGVGGAFSGVGGALPSTGGGPAVGGAAPGVGGAWNQCQTLVDAVPKLVEEAKACNPAISSEQCTAMVPRDLRCACPTYVNQRNKDLIAKINEAARAYTELTCDLGIRCGLCQPPVGAYCSPEGRCEERSQSQQGRACKVGGVVYPSGTSNIKNPGSPCNTCACDDGRLTCTEIACPSGCPSGTAFAQQCAECGPTDACVVPAFDCFPTCSTAFDCPSSGAFA